MDWRKAFDELQARINTAFDRLEDETAAKFRTLARSTGQRMRVNPGNGTNGNG